MTFAASAINAKAFVFLSPRDRASAGDLQSSLGTWVRERAQALTGLEIAVASRLSDSLIDELWAKTADAATSNVYQPDEYPVAPYEAAFAVTGPPGSIDAVIEATGGVANALAAHVDAARSGALAGTAETMIPARDKWMYLNFLRRRPRDSETAFHDYWRLEHTRLTMQIDGLSGYVQNHGVEPYNRRVAELAGVAEADVDGVVEAYAPTLDGFARQWHWEMSNDVPGDELHFLDVERSTLAYYEWTQHHHG